MMRKIIVGLVCLIVAQVSANGQAVERPFGLQSMNGTSWKPKVEAWQPDLNNRPWMLDEDPIPDKEYGPGPELSMYAAIVPGWGLYMSSKDKKKGMKYFLLAPITWGLVAVGISNKMKANKSYAAYEAYVPDNSGLNVTTSIQEMEDLYQEANSQYQSFILYTSAGVFVYLTQVVVSLSLGLHNDYYRKRNQRWKDATAFNGYIDPTTGAVGISASFNLFQNTKK